MYPDDYFDSCSPSEMQGIDLDEMQNSIEIKDSIQYETYE